MIDKEVRRLTKEIINMIQKLSGTYATYDIFYDWVKMLALSISNTTDMIHGKVWQDREKTYIECAHKHGKKTIEGFCKMNDLLINALDIEITDVLTEVFSEGGFGSKMTGQFFTPFHISYTCAQMAIPLNQEISPAKPLTFNEPSCGAGGMIIAAARVLYDRGINPQTCMRVVAQDLDWKSVYMSYVQFSLLGLRAIVVQGDTLAEPYTGRGYNKHRVLYTPGQKGLLCWM